MESAEPVPGSKDSSKQQNEGVAAATPPHPRAGTASIRSAPPYAAAFPTVRLPGIQQPPGAALDGRCNARNKSASADSRAGSYVRPEPQLQPAAVHAQWRNQ